MLRVFRNCALVNKETTSNHISVNSSFLITSSGIFLIRSAASKVSFSEYSFCLRGFSSFIIYFPRLQWAEPIVSVIGRKLGTLLNDLRTFGNP